MIMLVVMVCCSGIKLYMKCVAFVYTAWEPSLGLAVFCSSETITGVSLCEPHSSEYYTEIPILIAALLRCCFYILLKTGNKHVTIIVYTLRQCIWLVYFLGSLGQLAEHVRSS